MRTGNYEKKMERLLWANADYEARRKADRSRSWSIRKVEREWKLPAGQLLNFRANRKRRGYVGVTLMVNKKK